MKHSRTSTLRTFFALALLMMIPLVSFGQWSANPALNLTICDTANDQVLPKIATTPDGGCYISWFDARTNSYAVYLQRLNAAGQKQFAANGLLISANPQSTSLVDYDLISDDNGNAIVAFTDTRNGANINPFIYKISPQGTFLWGANGVTLADTTVTYQANPKVAKTSDGGYVVAWVYSSTPGKVAMKRLTSGGTVSWTKYLSGGTGETFTYPALVTSDSGSVIAMWSGYTGSFLTAGNYRLYTQKYSAAGQPVWSTTIDTVYNLGRVNGFYVPKLYSDGANGALYAWQDDRGSTNLQSAFVQRRNAAGVTQFPANGSAGSTTAGQHHFDPAVAYMPATGETFIFWKEANSLQSQFGIYGQKLSANGTRLWADGGVVFRALSQSSFINYIGYAKDSSVSLAYNEGLFGSNNNVIKAFRTDRSGTLLWSGNQLDVATVTGSKSKLSVSTTTAGALYVSWSDGRTDGGGIYAQNVNLVGTLGGAVGTPIEANRTAAAFALSQNYPNPFNPTTVINYQLSVSSQITLKVYDVLGREVSTLVNEKKPAGSYAVSFDGSKLSSGVYFYKLEARSQSGGFIETKKMTLVK